MKLPMPKIGFYAMTAKGEAVLKRFIAEFGSDTVGFVVTARDKRNAVDCADSIREIASDAGIPVYLRPTVPEEPVCACLSVSWRWLIPFSGDKKVIVFHDSLLPKYRGFAPLVSSLVNGEEKIGVTALLACDEYDRGPIIAQECISISYPITIDEAITLVLRCYENLAVHVGRKILSGKCETYSQDETAATYSLWRDEDDYFIDWRWDAAKIRRFVDAVGYPYKGAVTILNDKKVRLLDCEETQDVAIVNRTPGKVIFVRDGEPVVVCGSGLLRIRRLVEDASGDNALPLKRFRSRFGFAA
jgi:methionyl-tRNA formyltransferase